MFRLKRAAEAIDQHLRMVHIQHYFANTLKARRPIKIQLGDRMAAAHWDLVPGEKIKRTDLHAKFLGSPQGGVSPSRGTPNIFLFSDPKAGLKHGYVDRWDGELFHYTGEGQFGDQQMIAGNKSILHHASEGRQLRVFRGARGTVEYVGQFELDDAKPWYETDAPESGGRSVRSVIVFRLRPLAGALVERLPAEDLSWDHIVDEVDIAASNTEKAWVDPDRVPYEAELREQKLVQGFRAWLEDRGFECKRLRIIPQGEVKPLFNDIWVPKASMLVEAKGSITREAVRMAIGQLIDYGRFKPGAKLTMLLPAEPRPDVLDLIQAAGISLYWESGKTFRTRAAAQG